MTTATVSDLNQQLADDTDGAFPDLVRTFQDGVYSGALQLTRNDHDAQDVTQETFVRVYRALQRYDDARIRALELRPWIWTIALNLCRNRARARARRPEVSDLVDRPAPGRDPGDEVVAAFRAAREDPAVRAVILTGAGKGFCAGVDLDALKTMQGDVTMANGGMAGLKLYEDHVYVNDDSKVTQANILANNGVFHVVDNVVLPPWPRVSEPLDLTGEGQDQEQESAEEQEQ